MMTVDKESFHMWDAIVAWRDKIYQSDFYNNTKGNYLTGMLKLVEAGIVDICMKLNIASDCWLNESKQKIDDLPNWSAATKKVRKSCLNSFYNFIQNEFDYSIIPYRRDPTPNEIKHMLSGVQDKALTKDISPQALCNAICVINERDAYIVWVMMFTGKTLEAVLHLKKDDLKMTRMFDNEIAGAYLYFVDSSIYLPAHMVMAINKLCTNSSVYLFETIHGKRIRRAQVTRNLRQAGRNIGLDFDLNPKILHGYVNAYMSRDKRSELEKALFL